PIFKRGRVDYLNQDGRKMLLRVKIAANQTFVRLRVSSDLILQGLCVMQRPIELEPMTTEHGVDSDYDGSTDPENRQGARDTRAEARGSHARLEEVGEAATDAPTEEVASRTAPARPSGGCTATHTRSGNPEDA